MGRQHVSLALAAACAVSLAPASLAHAEPASQNSHSVRTGAARQIVAQSASARQSLMTQAQKGSDTWVKSLGLTGNDKLVVKDVITDADGTQHVRVERTHKGLKVVGGDMVLEVKGGALVDHFATFDDKINVPASGKIAKQAAAASGVTAAKSYKGGKGLKGAAASGAEMVIRIDDAGAPRLAFQVTVTGSENDSTPSRVQTFIDAETGSPITSYDEIQKADNGIFDRNVELSTTSSASGFLLKNPSTGNYTTDSKNQTITGAVMTDADDTWGNGTASDRASAAVDAQFGADKTFEYYKSVLGRNGIWNTGRGANSRVHYDNGYDNAFWDGTQMTYGDGVGNAKPLTELDVAAHEMSHGLNQFTANLNYSGDAGGLNEANSDIFGTAVEWFANLASDTPDYLIGEKVDLNGNGTPLRYMDKPSKDGVSFDCYSSRVGRSDPHYSSGPLNHWFYLASEGSGAKTINGVNYNSPTCNGSTVTGAGHLAVEKVWYRAMATKLTSRATYTTARDGAIASAVELYGVNSPVCKSVESAFNAISVPAGTRTCSSTAAIATSGKGK